MARLQTKTGINRKGMRGKKSQITLSVGYVEVGPHLEVIIKFLIYLSSTCQADRAAADLQTRFELNLIMKNRRNGLEK